MISRRSILGTGLTAFAAAATNTIPSAMSAGLSARAAGFRMPLESTPHLRTFMQWPAVQGIYGSLGFFSAVRQAIARIANSIVRFEPVVMLVRPAQVASTRALLDPAVTIWQMNVEDLWCRDSGPTFVVDATSKLAVSDLNFNGWGNKQQHAYDGKIARSIAAKLALPVFNNGLVGEGGGVETDGAGTLLAHESSWINSNRNLGSKADISQKILDALGADKIIWAPGLVGQDITDYHIDSLVRFVKPGQVVIQLPDKVYAGDPWSAAAYQTYNILKAATDAQGRKLEIVVIKDPVKPRVMSLDFVASYVNYYVCNGAVICSQFGDDRADAAAVATLAQLFPGRAVVRLNVDALGKSGGGIHCATQQQPVGA